MKKFLSLQNDHYLGVLIEFTLISLIILVLLNIPNLYFYLNNDSYLVSILYLLILPSISFLLFLLRFSVISIYINKSDNEVGSINRIFEKGKGWYEYRYENLIKTNRFLNSEEIIKDKMLKNAIERSSMIHGIEYLYKSKNDKDNKEMIRRQYFKGVSSIELMKKVYNINNINIKVNRYNKKKAYII